jgi:hypothetical protein
VTGSRFRKTAYTGLVGLGGCFVAAAVILAPFSGWERAWLIPAGWFIGLGIAYFAPKLSRIRNELAALGVIIATTLLTGSLWLVMTRVSPEMGGVARDFLRLFETAAALAAGEPIPDPEYQAVFPHLLGYPFVLSLLFRNFGASVAVAQAFNLVCFCCSGALLFSIGKKLMGFAGGFAAAVLWALLPSHFMLLSLVSSEPLHIMLTLCAVRIYLSASGRIYYWALLGLTVGASSLIRPVGPVYLLAFTLCAAVFAKEDRRKLAVSVLAMTAVYLAVTLPMAGGFGWNLYVGMNRESGGGWNASDYAVMEERLEAGLPAPEIQALFRREALERMGENLGTLPRFMARKFTRLWCQDSFTVYWLSLGMREDSPLDIRARAGLLSTLGNIAYGILLGCCALSLFRQVKTGRDAFVLPVTILTGVVLLFLLLEANPRYHYAGSAALCLLAAGCVTLPVRPADGREK